MTERRTINLAEIIERQKLTPFIIRLVVLSWFVVFFDGFDMNSTSFVAPEMSSALHIDRMMLGKVFSGGQTGMMLGGFFFGYLGDRIGRRPAVILATVSFAVLTLCLALSGSYGVLFAVRFLQGLAVGGLLPLAWALNIEYVPRRFRSTVVTLIMLGYTFGGSFAGLISIPLITRYGWRSLFVFGGCSALLVTALLLLLLPESMKFLASKARRPDRIASYARLLAPERTIADSDQFVVLDEAASADEKFSVPMLFRGELRWITPLLWFGYGVSSVAVFFNSNWGPTVLQAVGFSRSTAALAISITLACSGFGGLLLTRFVDTRGAISIVAYPLFAVPTLLVMGLSGINGFAFLVLNFFGVMFLLGAHLGLQSICGIFYPSAYRANGAGWAASIGKIGSIAGPYLGGVVLSSHLPVRFTYALLAICPCLVGITAFMIGRLQRRLAQTEEATRRPEPLVPIASQAGTSR
jgi:MFS transporter, AAHS family, 4-hydroxybenzoate transporter